MILLAIVAIMGLIELTVGREDYGSSEAEPGKLGEFWQAARPADPQVGEGWLPLFGSDESQGSLLLRSTYIDLSHIPVHARQEAATGYACIHSLYHG